MTQIKSLLGMSLARSSPVSASNALHQLNKYFIALYYVICWHWQTAHYDTHYSIIMASTAGFDEPLSMSRFAQIRYFHLMIHWCAIGRLHINFELNSFAVKFVSVKRQLRKHTPFYLDVNFKWRVARWKLAKDHWSNVRLEIIISSQQNSEHYFRYDNYSGNNCELC